MNLRAKRAILIGGLILIILSSFGFVGWSLLRRPALNRPLNILIVSFCSFRYQMLSHYAGHDLNWAPAIDDFFAHSSYVFDNTFNGLGWTGVFTYTRQRIPPRSFQSRGYHLIGLVEAGHLLRIPFRRSVWHGIHPEINDNDFEKDHQLDTNYLREIVPAMHTQPFFLVAHYKYMHYPFIDRFNADSQWDYYLSEDERRKIGEYLKHPGKYPEKMPFLLLLADDPKIALANPEVQRELRKANWKDTAKTRMGLLGLLTNEKFLKTWKESPGYADDLRLLEKVYHANARYLDRVVKPILNLWDNRELQESTVVYVIGDHGELHMERDHLTHGNSLYDEALKVPFAIRFPGAHGGPTVIKDQLDFNAVAKLTQGIVEGRVNAGNLEGELRKVNSDVLLARDCLNEFRGLRYKNKYKYFVRIADGQRFLFDLEKDPGETANLASTQAEVADRMEALYWENYSKTSDLDVYRCAQWQGAG